MRQMDTRAKGVDGSDGSMAKGLHYRDPVANRLGECRVLWEERVRAMLATTGRAPKPWPKRYKSACKRPALQAGPCAR